MSPSLPLGDADLERCNVSRESRVRLERFVALLLQWQARINLVSPATVPDVWHRHVLDSLQLVPLLPAGITGFADLGSGSGFPAVPLAIATGLEAHLYESNGKKVAFLREALRLCQCRGLVHQVRLEQLKGTTVSKIQLVTARALAPLAELLLLAEPFLAAGAVALFHKGQDVDAELTEASKSWRIQATRFPSLTDSRAVILKVEEARRV